jgi:phosphoglycolate phosphatase/putative hydrolase of the HAD superfamily
MPAQASPPLGKPACPRAERLVSFVSGCQWLALLWQTSFMGLDSKRLTTLVFDVDGTLYQQRSLRRAMLVRLLAHAVARPTTSLATFRALQAYRHAQEALRDHPVEGYLTTAQVRLASERSGQSEVMVAKAVARWIEAEPLKLLKRHVDPALPGFLAAARGFGMRLGVFSDYPAAAKLEAMGLAQFFNVVVSAQDPAVNRFKPDPCGLVETLRRLGSSPGEAVYVGDRFDVDARVAHAAGVPCIIMSRGSEPATLPHVTRVSDYAKLHSMLFPPAPQPSS